MTDRNLHDAPALLTAEGLVKIYGAVVATNNVSITIKRGDVLALVGGNGAGKSTLTKLIAGEASADEGRLNFDGQQIDLRRYDPGAARQLGIRVVHQELSLCRNLTVYENFYVEQPQNFPSPLGWRKKARAMALKALNLVFPDHGIDPSMGLADLSIAQQQMVEIARATCDPALKLLILDEPTSSLPTAQTEQLQQYIKKSSSEGVTYIYISHRLKEVMCLANRIYILQNGQEKKQCGIGETCEEDMIRSMSDLDAETGHEAEKIKRPQVGEERVAFASYCRGNLNNISAVMSAGEIVGLAGLEGNGQFELLQEIFTLAKKERTGGLVRGKVAYIAGDRKKEGIFPLWSIFDNLIISKAAESPLFKKIDKKKMDGTVDKWYSGLKIKSDGAEALITSLSGGNQQKVLIARAMALEADIILLDDPTRGVDVATKNQLYHVFQEAASAGKLIVWRTSEDAELHYCTRLLVMNSGRIAAEFTSGEVGHEDILKAAFDHKSEKQATLSHGRKRGLPLYFFSGLTMVILYVACGLMSPAVFSKFGIELLAVGFAPFIFAALAQTFIIGLGHIDLSVGAFMGFINVICATILFSNTALGLLVLIGALLIYSLMGFMVYVRKIPSIIMTLGMSFVWMGVALFIQEIPGGQTPAWLVSVINFDSSFIQGVLIWLVIAICLAIFIYRTRYGTVLRGFGNNENAVVASGWSAGAAYFCVYLLSGFFAMLGGISFATITGASDMNASSTFTMLTVAAVIIGGGYFSGGVVTHLGTVFGAVSLTMVSVLLGLFDISTDYTATIQGLVLLGILSLRLLSGKRGTCD